METPKRPPLRSVYKRDKKNDKDFQFFLKTISNKVCSAYINRPKHLLTNCYTDILCNKQ